MLVVLIVGMVLVLVVLVGMLMVEMVVGVRVVLS